MNIIVIWVGIVLPTMFLLLTGAIWVLAVLRVPPPGDPAGDPGHRGAASWWRWTSGGAPLIGLCNAWSRSTTM